MTSASAEMFCLRAHATSLSSKESRLALLTTLLRGQRNYTSNVKHTKAIATMDIGFSVQQSYDRLNNGSHHIEFVSLV